MLVQRLRLLTGCLPNGKHLIFYNTTTTQNTLRKSKGYPLMERSLVVLLFSLLLAHGCSETGSHQPINLKYRAVGPSPEVLAVYEPWFGHPQHISVGYSSHDPAVLRKQMKHARSMGISGFVVDWYGDRDPFNSRTYELMQPIAAEENFHIAMMYDETDAEDGATD